MHGLCGYLFSGGSLVPNFPRRLTAVLAPALLLAGAAGTAPAAAAATSGATCPAPIVAGDTVLCGTLTDGATDLIETPAHWNRTLFPYSHGDAGPGTNKP